MYAVGTYSVAGVGQVLVSGTPTLYGTWGLPPHFSSQGPLLVESQCHFTCGLGTLGHEALETPA